MPEDKKRPAWTKNGTVQQKSPLKPTTKQYPFGEGKSMPHQKKKILESQKLGERAGEAASLIGGNIGKKAGEAAVKITSQYIGGYRPPSPEPQPPRGGWPRQKDRGSTQTPSQKPLVKPTIKEKTKDKNRQWLISHGEDPDDPMFN